jgi:protein-tyrosine phosphatase
VIDLHCHILPGLDDGPPEMRDAVRMALTAVDAGVHTVVATPHVSGVFPNRPADIAAAAGALIVELATRGIALNVVIGAEVTIQKALDLPSADLDALRLGGSPYLLVECPLERQDGQVVEELLARVQARGHRVVLAHPERSPAFLRNMGRLRRLVQHGMLTSVTASAFTGQFGQRVQTFAMELLRNGLVHDIASDAHDDAHRSHRSLRAVDAPPWHTHDVPAAILEGRPVSRPGADVPVSGDLIRDGGGHGR